MDRRNHPTRNQSTSLSTGILFFPIACFLPKHRLGEMSENIYYVMILHKHITWQGYGKGLHGMLRITPSVSVAAAKSYYTQGLSRESYYSQGQEIIGQWYGKSAELLNLKGQVRQAEFEALCENQHPQTGKNLTPRTKGNRRVGYDLTFDCPKSVSLVYAYTQDEDILSAFRESVHETMLEVETDMQTRVRRGGKNEDRTTGNMIWAEFVHFTARPVSEKTTPDPQLHSHCFAFNATHDAEEDKWKAGQFGAIKRDAPYYQEAFHVRLAERLQNLGYGIERTKEGWEIVGIPKALVNHFSKRTAQIESIALEKGITDAKQKDALGAKTRKGKHLGIPMEELRRAWASQMTEIEKKALETARNGKTPPEGISGRQALEHAVQHTFERRSVASDRQIMAEALRYGVGSVTVQDIQREFKNGDFLTKKRDGQILTTTRNVLQEEKSMIDFVRAGRGTCRQLVTGEYLFKDNRLNTGQKNAVLHVLRSQDRVTAIRGKAGVGKTTLMKEAINAIEEGGKHVFPFAPTSEASRGVLRMEGFKNADTVQRLLIDEKLQVQVKDQVIWIDEAGLLGARAMNQVFEIAKKQNARVILSGDSRQHTGVERGDALRILEDQAGICSALVSEIKRQQGHYKEAVEQLAEGNIQKGYETLERIGAIKEIPDADRNNQLASDYLKALGAGKSALVVAPTHKEGEKVTAFIREGLKKNGAVGKEEYRVFQQRNLNWTKAQRADFRNYQPGMMLQLNQNVEGIIYGVRAKGLDVRTVKVKHFKRGEKLDVQQVNDRGELLVKRKDGSTSLLSLKHSNHFQVYETGSLPLAYGDQVRITQNGYSLDNHRLNNGAVYRVKGFTDEKNIILENDWVLPNDYGNLAHGYCVTSHASQGKTVDRVFLAQSADSFSASSREQFYVSVSRGREKVTIYTDDKNALKESIRGSGARLSATELTQETPEKKNREFAFTVNRLVGYVRSVADKTANAILEKYGRSVSYAQERLHELQQEYQREREREYGLER